MVPSTVAALAVVDAVSLAVAIRLAGFPALNAAVAFGVAFAGLMIFTRRDVVTPSVLDDIPRVLGVVLVAVLVSRVLFDGPGVKMLVAEVIAPVGAVVIGRVLAGELLRMARRHGYLRRRGIVVGAGAEADALSDVLSCRPELGVTQCARYLPGTGDVATEISGLLARHAADTVFVVASGLSSENRKALLGRLLDDPRCSVFLLLFDGYLHQALRATSTDRAWGLPLVRLPCAARSPQRLVKRAADTTLAMLALVLLAPVLVAVAIAVRIEVGPSILFRQERIGQYGRPFVVLKFRSMPLVSNTESATKWDVSRDERIGPVGRLIRLTALDELPQLWNVVRGDMSLVGPRPERPYFVERFTDEVPGYGDRHRMPVGLTGWAQVHGLRGDTSISDRTRFDNSYIDGWSLWVDVAIVLRTITHLATHMATARRRKSRGTS